METDKFFYRLFKQMPQTLFDLLGMPSMQERAYRFDSVEVKKSMRIDGLYLPQQATLPLYFVEVQFHYSATFYANLFAKVFCYLEENDPAQEWNAVAIFGSRSIEPRALGPYEDLLHSNRVRRIYLDEYPMPAEPSLGLSILQMVTAPRSKVPELACKVLNRSRNAANDASLPPKIVESLVEEILMRRFARSREEVLKMFELEDLRKTWVWKEAQEESRAETIRKMLAKGKTAKEIAELIDVTVKEVRRLAKLESK